MHDKRPTRNMQLLLIAALVFGAFTIGPGAALGAPQPTFLYLNPGTNSCGELWHGDEYTDYMPVDPAFVALWKKPPTDKARCTAALALFDKAELDYRLKESKTAAPDQNQDPCGLLTLALKGGLPLQGKYQPVCEALGYSYIGKVPANAIDLRAKSSGPAAGSATEGTTDDSMCAVTSSGARRSAGSPSLFGLLFALLVDRL